MSLRSWLPPLAIVVLGAIAPAAAWMAHGNRGDASATTASVSIEPTSSTITNATPVPVNISVSDVSGLAGYDAWVSFNGAVVQLKSLTDAGLLANPNPQGTPQNPVVCITPTIAAGYGHMACQILAVFTPVAVTVGSTPAPLVHASFGAVSGGTSQVNLTAVANSTTNTTTLWDLASATITANLFGGAINVTAVASVGGVAQSPDAAVSADQQSNGGSNRTTVLAIVGVVAAVVALGGGFLIWRRSNRTG